MSFCKGCGSEVEDELTNCPYCGTKIIRKNKPVNSVDNSNSSKDSKNKNFFTMILDQFTERTLQL